MQKNSHSARKLSTALLTFAIGISIIFVATWRNNPEKLQGQEPSYTITMNADNAPTSSTLYTTAEKEIRYSTFVYTGAKASSGNHVELSPTGYLGNKDDSQITSITSIQANFTTSGSLTLATSFDGINFTQTTIASGSINQTSNLPYHFRLTANSSYVAIQSVIITYSCAPHQDPIGSQVEYDITVNDYPCNDVGTDFSSSINGNISTYFTSDITLTGVSGTKIFGNLTPTATNLKFGSSSALGNITFNFASIKISQVVVNAYKYSSDTVSIKVTSSADTLGKTISIPDSTSTNYTFDLVDTGNSTSLTLAGVGKRFHLEGLTIISAGLAAGSPIETGFHAEDSNAANYKTNDVYATVNGITATVAMTSGSSIPVNYGAGGYSYVLKNSSNEEISSNSSFGTVGTYYAVVSYKSYTPITIELTVSDLPPVTLVSVSAVDSKTTYDIGDIYDEDNQLVVTATYSDSSNATIPYDATGANGYTIYCLDPNADDFYTSNPFTIAGDYLLTVTYNGIESNDVEFAVQAESEPVSEATINVLTNSLSDSTLVTSPATYLSASGVTISSASASNVYGGAGEAKFRFSSSKNPSSLTINFSSGVVITSVSLSVAEYNTTDTISIMAATSANTAGQSMTLSTASATLSYTAFANDTSESTSITISSPTSNRFFLYNITLGIGAPSPVSLTGVSLNKISTSLSVGETETLIPSILPSNANPNPNISWSTGNSSVATVSNGLVTGVGEGTTNITVAATQNSVSFSSSCSVTVSEATNYSVKTMDYDYRDYMDNNYYSNVDSMPSTGTVNLLVIPVALSGYPMTEATRSRIQKAYFGTEAETGWHSVETFYEEESHNRLDITGVVSPIYTTTYGASITESQTTSLVTTATNWYRTEYSTQDGREFDADSDGYIDGVVLIYSAPNYQNNNDNLWAYCFWTNNTKNTTTPTAKTYFWASYDFMDESSNISIDAHTYIHEAGHLMGLDDYYNYDRSSDYGAAGGFNMQDFNVGEHDPYSRVALGWIDPIVPTGSTTLTISPGQAIILSPNDLSSNSPFDEYLIIDVYSPTGLNYMDATYKYGGASSMYPIGPSATGIRVWHVDARLMRNYTGSAPTITTSISTGYRYTHAMSNSTDDDYGSLYALYRDYKLLHLLQCGGTNTYVNGGQFSASDLWTVGKSFSMSSYAGFFVNSGKLNSNTTLPYSFTVTAINGSSVTLSITKN
ncbi:MAG: Ig-like domain-containing protein [Bacilli bacterium]|nr:Ig-like domain-containing protein [Bacilli bacterium]